MVRTWQRLGTLLVVAAALSGCGPSGVQVKSTPSSGLEQAKAVLENYAKGAPMTSEVSTFPGIIDEVRKTDPQKADLLEKGFADLQKGPKSELGAKAKALLKKL